MTGYVRTYYLATCRDCKPLLAMPFTDETERDTWAETHTAATGHRLTYGRAVRTARIER